MLPVELFDFKNDRRPLVLDMAASPGGKTTHIISRTCDQGLVIANDSSRSRLTALRLVLQNWGAINKAISGLPGERFGELFPNIFDHVLLDAPCSMESLRSLDSHPMRFHHREGTPESSHQTKTAAGECAQNSAGWRASCLRHLYADARRRRGCPA